MQEEYIKRINKVLTYIEENLDSDLSLHTIAQVACYSPFHLHRLFKAITNEPLNAYVGRKRIERAAMLLKQKKELSIREICLTYGFTSNAIFSRAFKKVYGLSPSEFRESPSFDFSKIGKVSSASEEYICNIINLKNWIAMNATIEVLELPKKHLAYMTQIGEKGIDNTFQRLLKWARATGVLATTDAHICRVFHDSFKVTDADKVRMSIGVLTNEPIPVSGDVGLTSLEKGRTLVGHFTIKPEEFEKAWDSLFIWMNENDYKKADRFPFEMYHNNYKEHPEQKCIVDLCIPVEPAGRKKNY